MRALWSRRRAWSSSSSSAGDGSRRCAAVASEDGGGESQAVSGRKQRGKRQTTVVAACAQIAQRAQDAAERFAGGDPPRGRGGCDAQGERMGHAGNARSGFRGLRDCNHGCGGERIGACSALCPRVDALELTAAEGELSVIRELIKLHDGLIERNERLRLWWPS